MTYEHNGLSTIIGLPGGGTLVRDRDSVGRLWRSVDQSGAVTEYSYDPLGELETIVDPGLHTIRYERDDRGRLLTAIDPNTGTRTFVVDGFGSTIESLDANHQHVTHVRDELGRPTERYVDGQLESEWHWDTRWKGALDWERGGSGGAADFCRGFDYDGFGRTKQIATFSGSRVFSEEMAYDANYDRLKATRTPIGEVFGLRYASEGSLSEEFDAATGASYRYIQQRSERGQVTEEDFGNGLHGSYGFHASTGEVERISVYRSAEPSVVLQSLHYEYKHPLLHLTQHRNEVMNVAETFGFDELARIDWSKRVWGGDPATEETVDYEYDALGNLTRKSDYADAILYQPFANGGGGPSAMSGYLDRFGNTVADFAYDSNGNMTAGDGRILGYDAFDRPTTMASAEGSAEIRYDPSGGRYRRSTATFTKHYAAGGAYERIESAIGGGVEARQHFGPSVVVTHDATGRHVDYLHLDRLGSVDLITDGLGEVEGRYGYDPFGGPRDKNWHTTEKLHSGSFDETTDRGFTGHEHLDDQRLIHMNGRTYDYRLGRFLSVDPVISDLADSQTLNPYSYVRNNPLGFTDPSGFEQQAVSEDNGRPDIDVYVEPQEDGTDKVLAVVVKFKDGSSITYNYAEGYTSVSHAPEDAGGPSMAAQQQDGMSRREIALEAVKIAAEVAIGFTAAGVLLDARDLVVAVGEGDWLGAALAVASVIPIMDLVKGARRLDKLADKIESAGKLTGALSNVASKGADDAVTGFRAVSRAEADDIARHGFRAEPSGRSMESKWFSESREGAEWFRNNMTDLDDVVEARVPRTVYERSYRHANIDGTGPGFCVECSDLPLLTPVPK